jgi:porphobilinogen deaminase
MALARTEDIARRLELAASDLNVEIIKFDTTGDADQASGPLGERRGSQLYRRSHAAPAVKA